MYQQLHLKNKLSIEQSQNHGYGGHFDDHQMGRVFEGMREEVGGLSTNWQSLNSHGDVKYNIGNEVAKELTHMAHGYEQWWGDGLRGMGGAGTGWQREKNWDNYNSIINKIFFTMGYKATQKDVKDDITWEKSCRTVYLIDL